MSTLPKKKNLKGAQIWCKLFDMTLADSYIFSAVDVDETEYYNEKADVYIGHKIFKLL